MLRYLVLIVITLLSLSSAAAQEHTPAWTMIDVQPLAQVVGDVYRTNATVSLTPDGSAIAWQGDVGEDRGLFVYTFADQQTVHYPWPMEFRGLGRYSSPAWSPDGRYLAFNESLFDMAVESDLWLFDRTTGEITDRTNDDLYGGWFDQELPFSLDYLPTWNPATNDLYFFRSSRVELGDLTQLYLMPVERDEPKLASDLTNDLLVFSVYRVAAISPDGKRLALISLGSDLEDERNGIWMIDLATGEAEQVVSVADLRVGLPEWQTEVRGLYPESVSWAGNDAVVVQSRDVQNSIGITQIASYVDMGSGQVTPITTFDDVAENRDLYVGDDPESAILRIPRAGVVTPDGGTFIFLRHDFNREFAGVSAVSLPPDGSEPVKIGEIEEFDIGQEAMAPSYMSADGKALMYGYLFQFEPSS